MTRITMVPAEPYRSPTTPRAGALAARLRERYGSGAAEAAHRLVIERMHGDDSSAMGIALEVLHLLTRSTGAEAS